MKSADKRPASGLLVHYFVNKYIDMHWNIENRGAVNTQIFRISKGKPNRLANFLTAAPVNMIPG